MLKKSESSNSQLERGEWYYEPAQENFRQKFKMEPKNAYYLTDLVVSTPIFIYSIVQKQAKREKYSLETSTLKVFQIVSTYPVRKLLI